MIRSFLMSMHLRYLKLGPNILKIGKNLQSYFVDSFLKIPDTYG